LFFSIWPSLSLTAAVACGVESMITLLPVLLLPFSEADAEMVIVR
jgi:hypothetical protein